MTLQETIAEIKRQGGLVYVPHPFDRMHSVPDYEHLLDVLDDVDAIEVFNPRIAISEFNEEAVRFAAKYRIPAGRRVRRPRAPGPRVGADPDARFRRSRRVPGVAARRRHRPQPGEPALRPGAEVPADQGAAGVRAAGLTGPPRCVGSRASPDARARTSREPSNPRGMPATDDEIREKYLERAIRELNAFARDVAGCTQCPRGQLMPVLGSGHPQADIFLIKYSARPSEVEEGVAFYGRTGNALMKSLKRLSIDPLAVYGTLCVKCPVFDPAMADPGCIARLAEELAIVQPKIVVVMGADALTVVNELDVPLRRELDRGIRCDPAVHALDRGPVRAEHRRGARRGDRQARVLVGVPGARPVVGRPPAVLVAPSLGKPARRVRGVTLGDMDLEERSHRTDRRPLRGMRGEAHAPGTCRR